jgi:hypothetical protein
MADLQYYTSAIFRASILGTSCYERGEEPMGRIDLWYQVEQCIDEQLAREFYCIIEPTPTTNMLDVYRTLKLQPASVVARFSGIISRLEREASCIDSLLNRGNGHCHAFILARFIENKMIIPTPQKELIELMTLDPRRILKCTGVLELAIHYKLTQLARCVVSGAASVTWEAVLLTLNDDQVDLFKLVLDKMTGPVLPPNVFFQHAATAGATDIARYILDKHGNTLAKTDHLLRACTRGKYGVAKLLLERITELPRQEILKALQISVLWGHARIIELLLDRFVFDPSECLRTACGLHSQPDCVKLLLSRDARPTASDLGSCYSVSVAALLIATKVEGESLILAASDDNVELTKFLIANGANVNAADQAGYTALHMAARHGALGAIRVLLYADADVNARALDGTTPLCYASQFGRDLVARILVYAGGRSDDVRTHCCNV